MRKQKLDFQLGVVNAGQFEFCWRSKEKSNLFRTFAPILENLLHCSITRESEAGKPLDKICKKLTKSSRHPATVGQLVDVIHLYCPIILFKSRN